MSDKPEENIAYCDTYVTDQGNGGALCSHCHEQIELEARKCPHCKYKLLSGGTFIQAGGSDF